MRLTPTHRRAGAAGLALGLAVLLPGCEAKEAERSRADAARELAQVLALEPDLAHGLEIYRGCAECHQPEGWGRKDGSYPQLAGQHRSVIIKQMADIRACLRKNLRMFPFASADAIGGAQSVADVAGYIDTLEISTDTGKGPGNAIEHGAELYAAKCARCHGAQAEGSGEQRIPRLQSQHYAYLLRQFEAIRGGRRGNADPEMVAHVQEISDSDARAVLDYVSRIEPPKELQAPPGWRNPDIPRSPPQPSDG